MEIFPQAITDSPPKPFLKWAGGKRRLVPHFKGRLPPVFRRYYEGFLGGGAFFFGLGPSKAVLNDANRELIETWQMVQTRPEALLGVLKQHQRQHNKTYYYHLRAQAPQGVLERAARFIYLNRTCYNGLYRVNRQGGFNVPLGRQKKVLIANEEGLRRCHQALQGARLVCGDFMALQPERGDFVYLDPPYHPLKPQSFTRYTAVDFIREDQQRLHAYCVGLDRRGVHFMLSNACTPPIAELYQGFSLEQVRALRAINADKEGRGEVAEYLITNYR